mgnify:CR=1 FL=1
MAENIFDRLITENRVCDLFESLEIAKTVTRGLKTSSGDIISYLKFRFTLEVREELLTWNGRALGTANVKSLDTREA